MFVHTIGSAWFFYNEVILFGFLFHVQLYLMGTLEDCSSEFLKHPRTNYEDCLIRQENGGNCAPFSSGLPTPTDSGYPPSNCTVIPAIEELHGVDGRGETANRSLN